MILEDLMNEREFRHAVTTAIISGYDPLILEAQARHETGNFKHIIGKNNFWGLKVPTKSMWLGKRVTIHTSEHEVRLPDETIGEATLRLARKYGINNRNDVKVSALNKELWNVCLPQYFRDWDSVEESIEGYIEHIKKNFPARIS